MNTKVRRTYIPPSLDIFIIELENSIASGSSQVIVQSPNLDVEHGWDSTIAEEREVYW